MPSSGLAGKIAVIGVGTTDFGRLPDRDAYDLGVWALREALADAALDFDDIDGLIVNRIPDYQRFGEIVGLNPSYTTITPGHGRFAGICIETAAAVLAAGLAHTVALVYGNNGRSAGEQYGGATDIYGSGGPGLWFPWGMTSPGAFHALMARRHMHLYGTTPDQLGSVAQTFRRHAALNPKAVMREPFDLAAYHRSRFVCEPLHLLDYCLINDGGVALILTGADRARDRPKPPVYIRGFGQRARFAGSSFPPDDFWREPMRAVARDTYEMAGLGPADMSGLMIYDNFTPTVLFSLEGFGYCGEGESGPLVGAGNLALGGRWPTNTSGGHLSESYMQGWALNVEAVRQLRGGCGERQIPDAAAIQYMAASPVVTSIVYGRAP
ncbi:MAG: thiolase family protein [Alphaproteobacteria bacterium]|nr:thiolase family protein [Alphaproteobacteria bacterium]